MAEDAKAANVNAPEPGPNDPKPADVDPAAPKPADVDPAAPKPADVDPAEAEKPAEPNPAAPVAPPEGNQPEGDDDLTDCPGLVDNDGTNEVNV